MTWLSCDKTSPTALTMVMSEHVLGNIYILNTLVSTRTLDESPNWLVAVIKRYNTVEAMLLRLHLKCIVLREKPSIAPCITKSHLISLWLPSTCHSASEPDTQYFLLIISVAWVVRLRIPTGSTRHNEDLTRYHVTFTLFALRCPSILQMPRFGNLDRIPLTILSS